MAITKKVNTANGRIDPKVADRDQGTDHQRRQPDRGRGTGQKAGPPGHSDSMGNRFPRIINHGILPVIADMDRPGRRNHHQQRGHHDQDHVHAAAGGRDQ